MPPRLCPPSLFIVPQAPAPLRPHSHDPQRRATFGTTSSRCIYGEGFSLCHVGGGRLFARVVVPGAYNRRSWLHLSRARDRWTRRSPLLIARIAGSRKFTIGTISRHDSRHIICPPLILSHPFFLLLFYELSRAIVNILFVYSLTQRVRIDRSVEFQFQRTSSESCLRCRREGLSFSNSLLA